MPKVKVHLVDKKERYKIIGELFEIICNLRTKQEVIDFLVGLLTSSEALMIARRLQIAKMLIDESSYDYIRKKLKVSHQTIAAVEKWLEWDDEKKRIIIRKIREIGKSAKKGIIHSGNLLDKYPQHRFLKDIFE
ncbi:MAG: YerC/YecD family TrpR-related protein [Candidatus Moranbacteria bacterium]|nr:YerC/YecD family TrpR-related protein [Candidatus Moranbacteria bacterium]